MPLRCDADHDTPAMRMEGMNSSKTPSYVLHSAHAKSLQLQFSAMARLPILSHASQSSSAQTSVPNAHLLRGQFRLVLVAHQLELEHLKAPSTALATPVYDLKGKEMRGTAAPRSPSIYHGAHKDMRGTAAPRSPSIHHGAHGACRIASQWLQV